MICVELYRPEEENKFNMLKLKKESSQKNGEKRLIDRLKSGITVVSITKIVKQAEKELSKPVIIQKTISRSHT
jgi:hypothetical protein